MNDMTTTAKSGFDAARLRAEFPILERSIRGRPLVYLDSAASAQKPRAVIDAMTAVMETSYANVHRGLHTLANETTDAFEGARKTVAQFLNAASSDEIVFTRGTTEAINLVASSFLADIEPGDEIVVTELEHHSNIVPWHFLRERSGAVLRWARIDDRGALDMDALRGLITSRTKLVAVTHMSNVTGTVPDIAAIAAMAHEAGAAILVDGSQAAVHLPRVDVQALDVDFYAVTGHKLYGPTGAGALYAKRARLDAMRPYQGGGEMIESVSEDAITYNEPPHRFEAGTPAIIEAIGLGAALNWLAGVDRAAAHAHENMLAERLSDGLKRWDDIRILGEAEGKGAIVTFVSDFAHAHDIAQLLDEQGVAVRAGQHCAEPLMRRFSATSSCRASIGLYNTVEDVDLFLDAFAKARDILS